MASGTVVHDSAQERDLSHCVPLGPDLPPTTGAPPVRTGCFPCLPWCSPSRSKSPAHSHGPAWQPGHCGQGPCVQAITVVRHPWQRRPVAPVARRPWTPTHTHPSRAHARSKDLRHEDKISFPRSLRFGLPRCSPLAPARHPSWISTRPHRHPESPLFTACAHSTHELDLHSASRHPESPPFAAPARVDAAGRRALLRAHTCGGRGMRAPEPVDDRSGTHRRTSPRACLLLRGSGGGRRGFPTAGPASMSQEPQATATAGEQEHQPGCVDGIAHARVGARRHEAPVAKGFLEHEHARPQEQQPASAQHSSNQDANLVRDPPEAEHARP